ncbi:hypothetical protein LCM20_12215 [Halobacillus litoralis]|uniref:hypothetical protein n=1 Tax=Halobacillus litoralis TaxID=45668 RepID=UPI001CD7B894|nr:hypothetical protein [Halobacillus litoralis]MCA0971361.1 hypothetical protein [Halobacillus litoralis]
MKRILILIIAMFFSFQSAAFADAEENENKQDIGLSVIQYEEGKGEFIDRIRLSKGELETIGTDEIVGYVLGPDHDKLLKVPLVFEKEDIRGRKWYQLDSTLDVPGEAYYFAVYPKSDLTGASPHFESKVFTPMMLIKQRVSFHDADEDKAEWGGLIEFTSYLNSDLVDEYRLIVRSSEGKEEFIDTLPVEQGSQVYRLQDDTTFSVEPHSLIIKAVSDQYGVVMEFPAYIKNRDSIAREQLTSSDELKWEGQWATSLNINSGTLDVSTRFEEGRPTHLLFYTEKGGEQSFLASFPPYGKEYPLTKEQQSQLEKADRMVMYAREDGEVSEEAWEVPVFRQGQSSFKAKAYDANSEKGKTDYKLEVEQWGNLEEVELVDFSYLNDEGELESVLKVKVEENMPRSFDLPVYKKTWLRVSKVNGEQRYQIDDLHVEDAYEEEEPEEIKEATNHIELEPLVTTEKLKEWTVQFSEPMDPNTINEQTVYMEHIEGQPLTPIIELAEDKKTLKVTSRYGYLRFDRHHLVITDQVKSMKGDPLKSTYIQPILYYPDDYGTETAVNKDQRLERVNLYNTYPFTSENTGSKGVKIMVPLGNQNRNMPLFTEAAKQYDITHFNYSVTPEPTSVKAVMEEFNEDTKLRFKEEGVYVEGDSVIEEEGVVDYYNYLTETGHEKPVYVTIVYYNGDGEAVAFEEEYLDLTRAEELYDGRN